MVIEMRIDDVIKEIDARRIKWKEFAILAERYVREFGKNTADYPEDILRELLDLSEDDEPELLSDYFLDHECARWIVYELGRVIELLRKVEQ
jgi:hypothetical protein